MLEQNIQVALQSGQVFILEDAIDIREIKNLTLANQILKYRRIEKQKQDQASSTTTDTSSSTSKRTNC